MALKADDSGCDRKDLIREIYQAAADQEDDLTSDQKLLIERFVSYYAQLTKKTVDKVKKEVKMTFVASTITEHIHHEGEMIAEARFEERMKQAEARAEAQMKQAELRAEARAKRATIANLEDLFQEGLISAEVFENKAAPVREALLQLSRQASETPMA